MEQPFRKSVAVAAASTLAWLLGRVCLQQWPSLPDLALQLGVFGALVAAALSGVDAHFEGSGHRPRDLSVAAGVGGAVGALAGWGAKLLAARVAAGDGALAVVVFHLPWLWVGATVGLASAFRAGRPSRERLRDGFVGGLVGGALGGLVGFAAEPLVPAHHAETMAATRWALVGAVMALVASLSPGLFRHGRLVFCSSEAPGARAKLGRLGAFSLGRETLCLGSRPLLSDSARVLLIPDPAVRPVHCFLVHAESSYEVHYPEDNLPGAAGHRPVREGTRRVPHGGRLRHGARLKIGDTELRLELVRPGEDGK